MMGDEEELEAILELLSRAREIDFGSYRRSAIYRRLRNRVRGAAIDAAAYRQRLQQSPDELALLGDSILINVTEFYRDPEAWESLRSTVVPRLMPRIASGEEIRIWSAGCATGEEPYSAAILFADVLGTDTFSRQVRIIATDVDGDALGRAEHATYPPNKIASVPPPTLERWFERGPNGYTVRDVLRRQVEVVRHDLLRDPPMEAIDLVICRNTLMYFLSEAQARVLETLYASLRPRGCILLGRAESLFAKSGFAPLERSRRLYEKLPLDPDSGLPLRRNTDPHTVIE